MGKRSEDKDAREDGNKATGSINPFANWPDDVYRVWEHINI